MHVGMSSRKYSARYSRFECDQPTHVHAIIVWMCTCVCVYVCVHVCLCACVHVYMYACMQICMYVDININSPLVPKCHKFNFRLKYRRRSNSSLVPEIENIKIKIWGNIRNVTVGSTTTDNYRHWHIHVIKFKKCLMKHERKVADRQ